VEYLLDGFWDSNDYGCDDPILENCLLWGYRLLYVLLFISLITPMGQFEKPITLPFIGASMALLIPLLMSNAELLEGIQFNTQSISVKKVCSRIPIFHFMVWLRNYVVIVTSTDLYYERIVQITSCSTHEGATKAKGRSRAEMGCRMRLSEMVTAEKQTIFDELQQEIVDNIATQAFIRGKLDGMRNFEDYFTNEFNAKYISREDLVKAIQRAILVLQEQLK